MTERREVEYVSTWLPTPSPAILADNRALSALIDRTFRAMLWAESHPPTRWERITGRRVFVDGDGSRVAVSIGWRAELEDRVRRRRRQLRNAYRLVRLRRAIAIRLYDWTDEEGW